MMSNISFILNQEFCDCTWPQILHKEKQFESIVYGIMRCVGLETHIWRCSLKVEDVNMLGIKNLFWKEVLECWCHYNYYRNRKIVNQIIWYNSNIKVKGKPFFWKDSMSHGLLYVHQLFVNGVWKSDQLCYQEFGLSILRINALKSAIPKEWKEYFMELTQYTFAPVPPL